MENTGIVHLVESHPLLILQKK